MNGLGAAIAAAVVVGGVGLGLTTLDRAAAPDVSAATLTGCLRQGSGEAVFLLRGASSPDEPAQRDYLLVSIPAGVEVVAMLNHRVSVVGDVYAAADGPEPPPGANTVERALRRLAVQSLSDVAASCVP